MRTPDQGRILGCVLPLLLGGCVLDQNLDLLEYSAEDIVETDGGVEDGLPVEDGPLDDAGTDGLEGDGTPPEDATNDGEDLLDDAPADDGGGELCNGLDDDGDTLTDEDFDLTSDEWNCGTCGVVCADLDHVATGGCADSTCRIDTCELSWAECDDVVSNGCERQLDDVGTTCVVDVELGALSGDTSGFDPIVRTGWGNTWLRVQLTEDEAVNFPLTCRIALDVPPDLDYDLFVYGAGTCGDCEIVANSGAGVTETVLLRWDDSGAPDDSRDVYIWVFFSYGSTLSCGEWTLTVTGNQFVSDANC